MFLELCFIYYIDITGIAIWQRIFEKSGPIFHMIINKYIEQISKMTVIMKYYL